MSDLKELPRAPHNITGESIDQDKSGRYHIKVSNASGYLCHIHLEVLTIPKTPHFGYSTSALGLDAVLVNNYIYVPVFLMHLLTMLFRGAVLL